MSDDAPEVVPTFIELDRDENEKSFRKELETLINKHCMESGSDTPDFLLAEYLTSQLNLFDQYVTRREQWYGRKDAPATDPA